jgi:hypothetical protein
MCSQEDGRGYSNCVYQCKGNTMHIQEELVTEHLQRYLMLGIVHMYKRTMQRLESTTEWCLGILADLNLICNSETEHYPSKLYYGP